MMKLRQFIYGLGVIPSPFDYLVSTGVIAGIFYGVFYAYIFVVAFLRGFGNMLPAARIIGMFKSMKNEEIYP